MHVVIVGAGQAGASAAARLRALGHAGPITLFGAEPSPPYQRPPLSKGYLLGEMGAERLWLRAAEFWADQRIDLQTATPVTAIDPAARQVTAGGQPVGYDALVLATGSVPRRLPAAVGGDLAGVHTVRTLADVDAMRPEFVPGRQVVIVGGGYIGLEAAAVAAKLGLHVTVVEAAPRILSRVACAETADELRALHRAHGVRLIEGTGLDRLDGTAGHVTAAVLADGTRLSADFVIVGVGILPATDLAAAAGLALDNGIATDAQGRTSAPGIWAAGDCASFPHGGGRLRLESVGHAIDHGELVAENILGADRPYVARPWFWSDQYATKLQIAGLSGGHDRVVTRRGDGGAVSLWYFAADRLLAVDALDDPRAYMVGKRLIEAGRSPAPAEVATAADLKALLR